MAVQLKSGLTTIPNDGNFRIDVINTKFSHDEHYFPERCSEFENLWSLYIDQETFDRNTTVYQLKQKIEDLHNTELDDENKYSCCDYEDEYICAEKLRLHAHYYGEECDDTYLEYLLQDHETFETNPHLNILFYEHRDPYPKHEFPFYLLEIAVFNYDDTNDSWITDRSLFHRTPMTMPYFHERGLFCLHSKQSNADTHQFWHRLDTFRNREIVIPVSPKNVAFTNEVVELPWTPESESLKYQKHRDAFEQSLIDRLQWLHTL